jgi:hypothetical protein
MESKNLNAYVDKLHDISYKQLDESQYREAEKQIIREKYKHAFEVSKQQREDAQEMFKVQDFNRPKL